MLVLCSHKNTGHKPTFLLFPYLLLLKFFEMSVNTCKHSGVSHKHMHTVYIVYVRNLSLHSLRYFARRGDKQQTVKFSLLFTVESYEVCRESSRDDQLSHSKNICSRILLLYWLVACNFFFSCFTDVFKAI